MWNSWLNVCMVDWIHRTRLTTFSLTNTSKFWQSSQSYGELPSLQPRHCGWQSLHVSFSSWNWFVPQWSTQCSPRLYFMHSLHLDGPAPIQPKQFLSQSWHTWKCREEGNWIMDSSESPDVIARTFPTLYRAIMVKCLARGQKCHDQDLNPHSAADNTTAWVRWTRRPATYSTILLQFGTP